MLFSVRCAWFVAWWSTFGGCCVSFVVRRLLLIVSCLSLARCCLLVVAICLSIVLCCLLVVV